MSVRPLPAALDSAPQHPQSLPGVHAQRATAGELRVAARAQVDHIAGADDQIVRGGVRQAGLCTQSDERIGGVGDVAVGVVGVVVTGVGLFI